ncbi:hypothetical protein [Paludisphaera borealis]|nr:hypothetical protein [Paludisphaera borealis]
MSRLIKPDDDDLSAEAAKSLLRLRFDPRDLDRMHALATKNQDGRLTVDEQTEMESYRRVGFLLDLMHSKARRSLKRRQAGEMAEARS